MIVGDLTEISVRGMSVGFTDSDTLGKADSETLSATETPARTRSYNLITGKIQEQPSGDKNVLGILPRNPV